MKICLINIFSLFVLQVCRAQNVVQAEYFLDIDKGFGKNTLVNVTPSADGTFPFTINLATASGGYHQLYIRTKDINGKWSSTLRKNIEVIPPARASVTSGEYFFDTDPGFNSANPISISQKDTVILQNFTAVVSELPIGYHKLYVRIKDTDGKWSQTTRNNIEIQNLPVSLVNGGEYFFITDPGVGSALPFTFPLPAADSTFTFNIPLENIPDGVNRIYLRVKDSVNQNWSLTQWQTDSVITSIQSGLWSDVNTWSNHKVPVSNTVVILHHNVTVDIIAFCKSLTPYRNDVHLTVNQGQVLNITGH